MDQSKSKTEYIGQKNSSSIKSLHSLLGETFLDFQITEFLGKGGMGVVYKAKQKSLDRYVALKFLTVDKPEREQLEQLRTEAKIIAKLQHPNIVTIHMLGEDKGKLFLVMDFCEGKTLDVLLKERKNSPLKSKKQFPVNSTLKIIHQIALALSYAHKKNIIHKDIKPANIIIDSQNLCNVMDFGLAAFYSISKGKDSKIIAGTPDFMSPEQTQGLNLRPQTDMFSLGVIFYQMLTSDLPFDRNSLSEIFHAINNHIPPSPLDSNPDVTSDISAVVYMMMEKHPSDRYKTMEHCIHDLEQLMQSKVTSAYKIVSGYKKSMKNRKGTYKIYPLERPARSTGKRLKIFIVFFLICSGIFFIMKSPLIPKIKTMTIFNKKRKSGISRSRSEKQKLQMAKNYILIKRYDLAGPVLETIIEKDPDSFEAIQAKTFLLQMTAKK